MAYRKRFYESVEALQADLDTFLDFYNTRRASWLSHARPYPDAGVHGAPPGNGGASSRVVIRAQRHRPECPEIFRYVQVDQT